MAENITLTAAQRRFLEILADKPSIFAWKSKVAGRIVDPVGPRENWTHFQVIQRRMDSCGRVVGRRIATITEAEHFALNEAGLTRACAITDDGRAALAGSDHG